MGQYYYVVNLDKEEYIHPHKMGDGLKLLEFGCSRNGTMTALAILLADGNGRGGGDLRSNSSIIGSWAGDRIVVAGDYADDGRWVEGYYGPEPEAPTLYIYARENFREISAQVREAMEADQWLKEGMRKGT
tara:strand:- start:1759 stop:2151 length:393 start_codon:yes stop_codon:yes gene_type:complete